MADNPDIVIFNGSPRPDGSCSIIINQLRAGAESCGAAVRQYDLNHPDMHGCIGCFYCRQHPDCSIKDYFSPVYEDISHVSAVVFATPIYFAGITGQAKSCIDRLFPMLDGSSFQPRWPGKKVVSIYSQGDADSDRFKDAMLRTHLFFRTFGWDAVEVLCCPGTSAPAFAVPESLLAKARKTGESLAGR